MKHYKIVKKSTHFLIAISYFAVAFNAAILGAFQTGLIHSSSPVPVQAAADSCSGTGVSVDLASTGTNFQINQEFGVHVKVTDLSKTYKYQIFMKDVASGKEYKKGTEGIINTSDGGGEETTVESSSVGQKIVYAKYSMFDNPNWCEDWPSTNEIPISIGDNISDSANISINPPEKTDQGGTAHIEFTINNAKDKNYAFYISTQGGTCPEETDNDACWYEEQSGVVLSDSFSDSYNWAPSSSTSLGRHGVLIKLYDKTTGEMTDKKLAYTTVCAPGTAASTCVADNGSSTTATTNNSDDAITVPSSVTTFGRFTSVFKMPNQIEGAGDLVRVIIDLFLYLLGVLAFIGIVISGIQYVTSGGDSAKAEKAKKYLIYCTVGIILATLAMTLQGFIAVFWSGPS